MRIVREVVRLLRQILLRIVMIVTVRVGNPLDLVRASALVMAQIRTKILISAPPNVRGTRTRVTKMIPVLILTRTKTDRPKNVRYASWDIMALPIAFMLIRIKHRIIGVRLVA